MNLWLMAALVCGLGLSTASCSDDDDEEVQVVFVKKFCCHPHNIPPRQN